MPAPPPPIETRWKPGVSGNPGGRPKIDERIRRLAQADSEEAYQVVKAMMLTADKDSTRLAAALAILRVAGVSFKDGEDAANPTQPARPPVPSQTIADGLAPQAPIN